MENTVKTMQFESSDFIEVPVVVNGKPTKRMKSIRVKTMEEHEVLPIEIEGHVVYYRKDKFESQEFWNDKIDLYRADGSYLIGYFIYGVSGTVEHREGIMLDKKTMKIVTQGWGYDGRTNKGRYAPLKRIEW